MQRTRSTRFWIVLLGGIFLALLALSLLLRGAGGGRTARILVDGQVVRRIDLSAVTAETHFDVTTESGVNTIEVRPGAIRVVDADCPDQVCVRRGWLSGGRMPIVCLPHGLVIEIVSGGAEDLPDAVTG